MWLPIGTNNVRWRQTIEGWNTLFRHKKQEKSDIGIYDADNRRGIHIVIHYS
mgnify:CR=1 FL=1